MIELINVRKGYPLEDGYRRVLNNVTATFPTGQSVGVLGINGVGKSTLLRIIAGSEQPNRGRVRRSGKVSWPLGFSGSFANNLSGAQNLRFVCRVYDVDIDRATAFVKDFSELGPYMDEPIKNYSTGMRARLAFALSMAVDFDVYLVDETLGVGDANFQMKCAEAFAQRRTRSDVIMVSHNIADIEKYCDTACVLDNGRLTWFDDLKEAEDFYAMVLRSTLS